MAEEAFTLDLRSAAPPDSLIPGHGLWLWWLVGSVALILAVAGWLLIRRLRAIVARNAVDMRDQAYREAEAALGEVATSDPRDTAVRVSLIVRKYLSVAARDPALFETHEEFIARHDALNILNGDARSAAAAAFERLAALKYAPGRPDDDPGDVLTESRRLLRTLHHGFAP